MANNTKDPFNNVAKGEPKNRDKDNAAPEFKPRGVELPRRNLAPAGMSGIKRNLPAQRVTPKKIISASITKGDPDKHLFIDGKITGMNGYSFIAKVNDHPSNLNIEGGKISKLDIRQGGVSVARFDRGWDVRPQTVRDAEAVRKIQDKFGGKERAFKPIVPKSPDKDHGHER